MCIWPYHIATHCLLLQEIHIGFGFNFLVPAHPGSPGQNPEGCKMVVVVVVAVVYHRSDFIQAANQSKYTVMHNADVLLFLIFLWYFGLYYFPLWRDTTSFVLKLAHLYSASSVKLSCDACTAPSMCSKKLRLYATLHCVLLTSLILSRPTCSCAQNVDDFYTVKVDHDTTTANTSNKSH